jgi:L-rhamnose isomerase
VSYTIIYIPTKSSSNEIENLVVIFIHLQLTLSRVVEYSRDHVRLLDDLPNSMILPQEIVVSSIFSVTEILVIENDQLDSTFLYVTFMLQSLLKSTSDQISFDTN